jgi:hypothetical protein
MNAKLANWLAGIVLPSMLTAGWVVDATASARTSALASGPVELWRTTDDGVERAKPDARAGKAVPFGYRISFELGDKGVSCVGRFARYQCDDGWRVSRVADR